MRPHKKEFPPEDAQVTGILTGEIKIREQVLKSFERNRLCVLAHDSFDLVFTVCKLINGNHSRIDLLAIYDDISDTLADMLGILNLDVEVLSSEGSLNLESVPGIGDTGIDEHSVVLGTDTENILGK